MNTKEQFTVRLEGHVLSYVRRKAHENDRTVNKEISHLLRRQAETWPLEQSILEREEKRAA